MLCLACYEWRRTECFHQGRSDGAHCHTESYYDFACLPKPGDVGPDLPLEAVTTAVRRAALMILTLASSAARLLPRCERCLSSTNLHRAPRSQGHFTIVEQEVAAVKCRTYLDMCRGTSDADFFGPSIRLMKDSRLRLTCESIWGRDRARVSCICLRFIAHRMLIVFALLATTIRLVLLKPATCVRTGDSDGIVLYMTSVELKDHASFGTTETALAWSFVRPR